MKKLKKAQNLKTEKYIKGCGEKYISILKKREGLNKMSETYLKKGFWMAGLEVIKNYINFLLSKRMLSIMSWSIILTSLLLFLALLFRTIF